MNSKHSTLCLLLLLACGLGSGCNLVSIPPSIHQRRVELHENTVVDFEQKRDAAQYKAAMTRWRTGDIEGCRSSLLELVQRSPDHLEGRLALADMLLYVGEAQQAEEHARQAVQLASGDARAAHSLGLALEALGQHDAAAESLRRAIELDPKNETYRLTLETLHAEIRPVSATVPASPADQALALAVSALESNQTDQAIRIATDALARFPDHAGLYRILGTAEYRRANYAAAESALRKSVSLDAASPLSYFLLSATLKKLGQVDEALRVAEQAASLDPVFSAWR